MAGLGEGAAASDAEAVVWASTMFVLPLPLPLPYTQESWYEMQRSHLGRWFEHRTLAARQAEQMLALDALTPLTRLPGCCCLDASA